MKRKKRRSKSLGQRIHAKRRLYERYGFIVNSSEYDEIKNKIKSKNGWFLKKLTCRLSLWLIKFKDEYLFTVYDRTRSEISTFLTLEMGQVREIYAECEIPLDLDDLDDPKPEPEQEVPSNSEEAIKDQNTAVLT